MAEGGTPRQSVRYSFSKWSGNEDDQHAFKDSYSKGSGGAYEPFCDPCRGEGKLASVAGYCQECSEFMCETCLGVHRKQRLSKDHNILNKTHMPTEMGSPSTQDLCVDVCTLHHLEIVNFYCKVHDVPGCVNCMTLHHQKCKRKRIEDISDGYDKTQEFKHIDQKLQQFYQDPKDIEGDLNNNQKILDKSYEDLKKKIKAVRKEVNDYLDQMEKQVTDKADQMKKEDTAELNRLISESQTTTKELKNMLDSIHQSNVNINTLFVTTKQAKQRLATMEWDINSIRQKQQQQQRYKFEMSNVIHQIVSAKTPLGYFSRINTPYTATTTYNCSINVKCKKDKEACRIIDSTILRTHMLVITDWDNENVKLINTSNNTVKTSFTTPSAPYGVTALSTDRLAVTLPDERKILLLKVTSSSITKHSEIEVRGECYGIAHKDGKLAVSFSDPLIVEILDIQGKVLHEIKPHDTKDKLQYPDYILFGQDRDTVIVSDRYTNKISVITFSGQILHTYTHAALKGPRGIVMTEDGLLFVCSLGNGSIHVLSEDFKSSKSIINQDKHVVYPESITYCDNKHRLYIFSSEFKGMPFNSKIQVYDLND